MEISYKGGNSVVVATKKTSLLIDPKVSGIGLKDPAVTDAVEVLTDDRHRLDGARLTVDGPGEYEVGDFSVRGIAAMRSTDAENGTSGNPKGWPLSTVYRIETTDFRVGVLGNITGKLSDNQLEELGVIDILVLPVGGNGYTLDPHDAATLTRQIDPKVVIPVSYEEVGLTYEVPQLPLSSFTSELNLPVETVDRFKPKNAAALPETLSIVQIRRG